MKNDIRTRKIGQPHFQLAQTFTFTFVSVGCELWAGSLCLRCSNEKCLCKLKIEKFSEIFMTEGSSRLIGFAKQESAECCEPSGKHDRPRRNLTVNNIWFGAAGCEKDYHCWRSSNNSRECGEAMMEEDAPAKAQPGNYDGSFTWTLPVTRIQEELGMSAIYKGWRIGSTQVARRN